MFVNHSVIGKQIYSISNNKSYTHIKHTCISFSESLLVSLSPIDEIGTLLVAVCCVLDDCPMAAVRAAWDEARTLEAINFPGPFLDLSVVSLAKPCPFMTK